MKRINLIPQEKRLHVKQIGSLPNFIQILLVIFLIIILFQIGDTIRLKILISARKNKIALLDTKTNEYERIYNQIKEEKTALLQDKKRIEEKINTIKRIKQEVFMWSKVLEDIARLTPEDVLLKSTSLNKDTITIIGATQNNLAVSKFMQALDDSENFKNTNFSYTRKEKVMIKEKESQEVVSFSLITYLERQNEL